MGGSPFAIAAGVAAPATTSGVVTMRAFSQHLLRLRRQRRRRRVLKFLRNFGLFPLWLWLMALPSISQPQQASVQNESVSPRLRAVLLELSSHFPQTATRSCIVEGESAPANSGSAQPAKMAQDGWQLSLHKADAAEPTDVLRAGEEFCRSSEKVRFHHGDGQRRQS